MRPIRKLLVTFQLGTTKHKDELHIYPEVTGVLLSWKADKGLKILHVPECYPHPINITLATPKKCLHSLSTKLPNINLSRMGEGIRNSFQWGDQEDGG